MPLLLKNRGLEGGLFQKMINGYIFYFLGQLFSGQLFELFACETNLKKESSVSGGKPSPAPSSPLQPPLSVWQA